MFHKFTFKLVLTFRRTTILMRIKTFWIILFLSAQIATLTGVQYGLFKIRKAHIQSDIKNAIKEGIPKHKLVEFRFHKEDNAWINLEWTKRDKEFRYNSQMYDIIETKSSNDTVYFQCVHDVKETGPYRLLDLMTQNKSSKDKSIVVYWSKQIYYPMNEIVNQNFAINEYSKKENLFYTEVNFNQFVEAPQPPPPKEQFT